MLKTFKYRLYPNKQLQRLLEQQLEECRCLYNYLLAERRDAWEQRPESLRYYDQAMSLPALKAERPSLTGVQSQVLQNVAVRIDLAFQAFFRGVRDGDEKPGYPRFRGRGRYDSITFPQVRVGCKLEGEIKRLRIMNVGQVKVVVHRPLEGTPKTATIRRSSTSKWYVTFSCECAEPAPLPATGQPVGIDIGLKTFITLSTGDTIANPRFFRQGEQALAKAQRKHQAAIDAHTALRTTLTRQAKVALPDLDAQEVSRLVSQERNEQEAWRERHHRRRIVARVHECIRWRRSDFTHQHSRHIVNQFDMIAVEDVSVNRMMHNHCLAKSIHDAAWTQFAELLACKAAWAGRQFVAVNPAYTSQTCSGCGHRQPLSLADRIYTCSCCGLVLDRDLNAARTILALGQQCLPSG